MSIKLVKRLTFAASAGFIVLSSINVAQAFPNLCGAVGASQIGAPTACADCHTGNNPSGNNYTGGCSPIAPPPAPMPTPMPTPSPTPTPTPGGGMNNPGMGDSGAHGGRRMEHQRHTERRMRRHERDSDRRGSRRHGRDDD